MWIRRIAVAALAVWLVGCGILIPTPTPTITPTPEPTITPTPTPLIPPDQLWGINDGGATFLYTFTTSGEVTEIKLPLNEGQTASNAVAAADGAALAYLVNDGADQRGIATWTTTEPNARLVYQPLSGYRVSAMTLSRNGQTLAFVETQNGKLPADADWRLQTIPTGGGSPTLLSNLEKQGSWLPPMPLDFGPDGTLYVNATTRADINSTDVLQGIFAVSPAGEATLASPLQDRIIGRGTLSPDGTQLAYTVAPGSEPGQPATQSVGRVYNLVDKELSTLTPPEGQNISSLAWMSGSQLLLDISLPDNQGTIFALANRPDNTLWVNSAASLERMRLFTYEPFGQGVIYTLLPGGDESEWRVYIIEDLADHKPPHSFALGPLDVSAGPLRLIYVPAN
jgi:hypothetical protein